jgi:hypothetical protein
MITMTAQAYDFLMQRDDLWDLFTRKDDYNREKNAWITSGENVWKWGLKHGYFDY